MPICPAGNAFTTERMNMKTDDIQILEVTVRTRCEHCNICELKTKCTKAKNGRTMDVDLELEAQKSKVRALLSSDDGKIIMIIEVIN